MQVIVILNVSHENVEASIVTQHPMNAAAFRGEIAPGPASAEQSIAEARKAMLALADAVAFVEKVNIRHGGLDEG